VSQASPVRPLPLRSSPFVVHDPEFEAVLGNDLEPGMTLPDFTLPDETGTRHRLSTLQGTDVLVLQLSRGEHCPRERMHHRELLRFHEWCDVGFTQLVSILPNTLHDTYKMKIATGAHWTFLADEGLEVRTALEIDEYTDIHHDYAGLRIEKVYVGYWFWGRPSPEQLWIDLQEVHKRIKADYDPTLPEARAEFAAAAIA
jgi:peroxiredoxin